VKRFFKWAVCIAAVLAALSLAGFLLKDSLLRIVIERRIRSKTGMKVEIGQLSSGVLSPVVTIRNLKLYNTAGFGGTLLLEAPELRAEFDRAALRRGELLVTRMRVNLSQINIVRNESGQTNLFSIRDQIQAHGSGGKDPAKAVLGHYRFAGIRELDLSVGKTRFIDLKDSRNDRERDLHLQDQVFRNVNSEADVYGMLFLLWLRSRGSG
jgi:hypothetical protein